MYPDVETVLRRCEHCNHPVSASRIDANIAHCFGHGEPGRPQRSIGHGYRISGMRQHTRSYLYMKWNVECSKFVVQCGWVEVVFFVYALTTSCHQQHHPNKTKTANAIHASSATMHEYSMTKKTHNHFLFHSHLRGATSSLADKALCIWFEMVVLSWNGS